MKTIVDYNYHNHTYRCGHATGSDEEYVEAAIRAGYKVLGFSDHVFIPGVEQPGIRGSYSQLDDYLSSVSSLKEKYKDMIEIHVAFECEYLGDECIPYYKSLLEEGKVEYLLLGQHCYMDENGEFVVYNYKPTDPKGTTLKYCEHLIKGIESGLFSYVCHPEWFVWWNKEWDDTCVEVSKRIIQAAIDHDIPLEINLGSARRPKYRGKVELDTRLPYPCPEFWDLAAEMGAKCVIGVDAHEPWNYDECPYWYYENFISSRGLKVLDNPQIIKKK